MQAITIGTAESPEALKHCLHDALRPLADEGVDCAIIETQCGGYRFLGCRVDPADDQRDAGLLFRHSVAHAVSDLVVDRFERGLLRKLIKQSCYYFSPDEQEQIYRRAAQFLAAIETAEETCNSVWSGSSRKAKVLHRLLDYLDQSDELVVEGFITFRLKDYVEELEDAVDHAVDDFLMEREYREFVRLLKYFVDIQEPRLPVVHVHLKAGGLFELTDAHGMPVRDEQIEEFVLDLAEAEVSYDDLLISALITLAPARVVLHGAPGSDKYGQSEAVQTIEQVFLGRVELCGGCPVCADLAERRQSVPQPT